MNKMKIATYNTFFDPHLYIERFTHIMKLLHESDVVCLQEIPSNYINQCEEVLRKSGFIYQAELNNGSYGLITASKIPFEKKNIFYTRSIMGRGFIHVYIKNEHQPIHVINTHLESMYQFQPARNLQMKELVKYCKDKNIIQDVVICGDLNMVFQKIFPLDNYFKPHVDFPTWFGTRFSDSKRSCNFDRIYTGKNIQAKQVEVVGNELISELDCYPSDHDGLILEIETSDVIT